jgi:hypothetical protein
MFLASGDLLNKIDVEEFLIINDGKKIIHAGSFLFSFYVDDRQYHKILSLSLMLANNIHRRFRYRIDFICFLSLYLAHMIYKI